MRLARALLIAGLICVSPSAFGQGPAPDDPRARHERAEELFAAGKHAEAAAIWEDLLKTVGPDKAWRANYNLGLCYSEIDRPTLAVERFEAFVLRIQALVEVPAELAELRDDAKTRMEAIRASHGRLELPAAAGVRVRIDGGELRDVGFTAYVTPGQHSVEVVGADGAVRQETVKVAAGRAIAIQTTAPRPAPQPPEPPPPPKVVVVEEAPSFPTVWVLIGAGLTAASFVFPGVMYARASDARDEATALGAGHTDYAGARETFADRYTAYELSYLLPAGLGAVTGVVAVVGAITVATWTPPAEREGVAALTVGCSPMSGGAGCNVRGSF
jgi:hypothetical protein